MDPYRFSTSNRVGPPRNGRKSYGPARRTSRKAYGLPGTSEGLQRIQNEVQRAITEGGDLRRVDTRFFLWHKNGIS